jgi:hypothetical protein
VDDERKFCPVIVSVNAAPPAVAEFGLRETMAGTGLEGGGGLPPELPDPPPQPDKSETSRHASAILLLGSAFLNTVLGIDFSMRRLTTNYLPRGLTLSYVSTHKNRREYF